MSVKFSEPFEKFSFLSVLLKQKTLELDTGRLGWLGLFPMLLGSPKQVWIVSAYGCLCSMHLAQLCGSPKQKFERKKETVLKKLARVVNGLNR